MPGAGWPCRAALVVLLILVVAMSCAAYGVRGRASSVSGPYIYCERCSAVPSCRW